MARRKTMTSKPKRVSAKKVMEDTIAEARKDADIKPITRASKGAKYLKASPWDRFRFRKVRLHNGTIECDTDEMFDIIAKQVKEQMGLDITEYKTPRKEYTNGEDQTDT